ncbi:thioesterase family protein [Blastococcus goldschmidtiae]|uniref:Thioesterase family protein n=1 Tax=Blastococcus goldschmidtiae TaxID=3075546 RepID=A0ABU2K332_9ACTN|nr:thioesterase family protein [Blastococcus sp. DSM 46792]MDT0274595.1 thioesterase family protein [Blastococcus sp. DSM 46792]
MELPGALYAPTGEGFTASALTIGPWDPALQHAGPPAALLAREAERAGGIPGGQTVRLNYDILGPVPVGPVRISTTVLRPGRRVELVEAVLDAGGRPLMRLSAWRMRTRTEGLPAAAPGVAPVAPHPAPAGVADSAPGEAAFFRSDVAYHKALEWRFASGGFNSPGPAAAWTRPRCTLVEGEPISPLQHLLVMTDAASGISAILDGSTATFANVDLSVSLHRPPRGEWLGMDATTVLGDSGAAQCSAVLFDADGAIGRSTQSLFVEPR